MPRDGYLQVLIGKDRLARLDERVKKAREKYEGPAKFEPSRSNIAAAILAAELDRE